MTDTIPHHADIRVEEVLAATREAIYKRALKYSRGPTLTDVDIERACQELYCKSRWPGSVTDHFNS